MNHDQDHHYSRRFGIPVLCMIRSAQAAFFMLLLLCASTLLLTQHVAAKDEISPQSDGCGQSRLVLVRFLNGEPVSGVRVIFSAAPPAMGGPELYKADRSSSQSTAIDDSRDIVVSPLLTPAIGCTPVITGTLTMVTDASGQARFDWLGEGTWIVQFEGVTTHGGRTASVVPASVQGLFPYGRTREGGGFFERVDALNEHGGPNPEPVSELATPGTGLTTSRYVLHFSAEHYGWLPGLDLAAEDGTRPVPLAGVTPVTATLDSEDAGTGPGTDGGGNLDNPTSDTADEFVFDPGAVEVVSAQDKAPTQPDGQPEGTRLFNVWWAVLLVLWVSALAAIVWGKRRASIAHIAERAPVEERRRR